MMRTDSDVWACDGMGSDSPGWEEVSRASACGARHASMSTTAKVANLDRLAKIDKKRLIHLIPSIPRLSALLSRHHPLGIYVPAGHL